ncbi:MAG: Dolichyl-phosphate-mannose-protein mannosyltransferase family protein [uncultured bacterium]|nr:MAG: Dolichyl-phosphate-mannose-protein mannosyltransferase family protein [uncultured bacterium]
MTWLKDFLVLTLIIGLLFGATLGRYPLAAPDGARYAEIPREMVVTGDYITPHLNGVKYFEKPPLFYWLQAISIKAFGANELAVSIVNALMALGCSLLIYFTGRKLYGRLNGIVASFIFATTSLVFALTRVVTLDVALTFFITGSLCSFMLATQLPLGIKRSSHLWAMYVFAALAVMTKGLIGAVFPALIVLIWTVVFNEWRNIKTYRIISGLFLFLLIALPWHILVQIKNPEFFRFYFIDEHFLRYSTGYAGRSKPWWFLPALLLGGLYPWMVFLPQTIMNSIPKHFNQWQQNKPTIFLVIWALTIYAFYTFSNSQLIPYILPVFPPIALLIGNYLATYWQSNQHRPITIGFNVLLTLNIALGIGAIAAIFTLNFSDHTITKQNLYIAAACVIIGGVISIIAYRRRGLAWGFTTLTLAVSILWLYLSPIITTINKQSIKPLIITLQQKLKPDEEVISYGHYYQDLPFYLQRIITVANFANELTFGMRHQDTKAWMIDTKTFWERWNSNKRVYLITDTDSYRALQPVASDRMHMVGKYLDDVLLVNIK